MTLLRGRLLNGKPWLVSAALAAPYVPPVTPTPTPTAIVTPGALDDHQVLRRQVWTGNPPGFTTTFNKGWGAVGLTVNASVAMPSVTLMLRLRDAANPGTYAAPGTVIQDWIAIPGVTSLASGANTITIQAPGSLQFYIADIAVSGHLDNGISVSNPFGVGYIMFAMGPSLISCWFNNYAYYTGNNVVLAGISDISPSGVCFAQDRGDSLVVGAPGANVWKVPEDNYYGAYQTPFASDFLRLTANRLGVVTALTGWAHKGADWAEIDPFDTNSDWFANVKPLIAHIGQFDALFLNVGQSSLVGKQTIGETAARAGDIMDAMQLLTQASDFHILAGPLPGCVSQIGAPGGYFEPTLGFAHACARLPNAEFYDGGEDEYYPQVGHTGWRGRQREAQSVYRRLMAKIGPARGGLLGDGPTMVSATRAAGSADIIVTYQHHGGSNLVAFAHADSGGMVDTVMPTPSAALLAQDFALFPPGTTTTQLAFDATIINAAQVRLRLATLPADGDAFDLWRGQPVTNVIPPGGVPSLRDDYINGDGILVGHRQRGPAGVLWPLYVAAPTGPAQTLAVSGVTGFSGTPAVTSGAMMRLYGTWAGAVSGPTLDVHLDGSAFVTLPASDCTVVNSGTWAAIIQAPAMLGAHSWTVRMTGTTASATINFTVVAQDLPLSSPALAAIGLDIDPRVTSRFYADTALSQPASDGTFVFGMAHPTNPMTNPNLAGMRLAYRYQNGLPALHSSSTPSGDQRYALPSRNQRVLQTALGDPLPGAMRGSWTIFMVFRNRTGSGTALGSDVDATGWYQSVQGLFMGGSGNSVFVSRVGATTGNVVSLVDATPAPAAPYLRKLAARFDANTGTLQLQHSPASAALTGAAPGSAVVAQDYASGLPWQHLTLGRRIDGGNNAFNSGWGGGIHRVVMLPGYIASDADVTAVLTQFDALYGA